MKKADYGASLRTRRSCWQHADVHIPFNEQISGLTANSNEKQRVRGCTISSDLLVLLQIKVLRCESRWYLRRSASDARDDLCVNQLSLLWRWAVVSLEDSMPADTILSFLSAKYINLSLYSCSCDSVLRSRASFVEILTLLSLFLCQNSGKT